MGGGKEVRVLCFTLQTTTHTSRITLANTPSVHSKVCRSYSPYRLAYLWDGGGWGEWG